MTRRFGILSILVMSLLLAGTLSAGCAGEDSNPGPAGNNGNNGGGEACDDRDQDGYLGLTAQCQKGSDCDDDEASINPGGEEVCGDGRDNDCTQGDELCEEECTDADGDRYGVGAGCFGPDCDDTNAAANPDAQEVCGNQIDEDCDGIANECPTDCTDDDGDGFGVAGSNSDCPNQGDDCDDADDTINPNAEEVCNGADDNCDGTVDECAQAEASCNGTSGESRCVVPVGGACQSNSECADNARCDNNVSECRLPEGESCSGADECLDGFACDGGTCSGDFCAVNSCTGDYAHCDADAQKCVECRHWDENAGYGDDDCSGGESCTLEGWCAEAIQISNSEVKSGHAPLTTDVYEMSIALADCWIDKSGGSDDMCAVLYVASDVTSPLTKSEHSDAYTNGELDGLIDSLQNDALDDLWGVGVFDVVNADFKSDPQPDTFFEYCIWYDTQLTNELIIEKCADFSP
jgi:hypothetical protein